MFQRPTRGVYQAWADKVGDQAYTWDNMIPFLERSVQFSDNAQHRPANATPMYNTSVFSPTGGPLQLSYPGYVYPLAYYGEDAFSSIGLEQIPGFTTGSLHGWGYWQFTIDPNTGLRSSSESSFLAEAIGRPGLTTYVNAMARNILFSGQKAVGVNITNMNQQPFNLTARKEVIVSAGLYNSPQLLMVSGIGPKETLDQFDIPVVVDAPGVGQNTRDSCAVNGPVYEIDAVSYGTWQQPDQLEQAIQEFQQNRSGPMTNIGMDLGAFEKLPPSARVNFSAQATADMAEFPADWPEIEYLLEGVEQLNIAGGANKSYATLSVMLQATTSRGNMTIRSADNMVAPIIQPNWLQNTTDQEVALAAFRRARQAWQAIPISVGDEIFPGSNVTTDEDLLDAIYKNFVPTHHGTASCEYFSVHLC